MASLLIMQNFQTVQVNRSLKFSKHKSLIYIFICNVTQPSQVSSLFVSQLGSAYQREFANQQSAMACSENHVCIHKYKKTRTHVYKRHLKMHAQVNYSKGKRNAQNPQKAGSQYLLDTLQWLLKNDHYLNPPPGWGKQSLHASQTGATAGQSRLCHLSTRTSNPKRAMWIVIICMLVCTSHNNHTKTRIYHNIDVGNHAQN